MRFTNHRISIIFTMVLLFFSLTFSSEDYNSNKDNNMEHKYTNNLINESSPYLLRLVSLVR
jgi:hypothetical protein